MHSVAKMSLKGEVGGHALNRHGNYIVDHEKSRNCVFQFLWEPCVDKKIPPSEVITTGFTASSLMHL